jgi:bifunctional UDP-N-acetylglucosamine pyrophosphorylase/glucosamine-1-phosphate N-acetyltransferase
LSVEAVILAAGQGTRMKSTLPKVLHPLAGKPLLGHVLRAVRQLGVARVHTIVGHGADAVQARYADDQQINWVLQREQKGTGHALLQVMPHIETDNTILVLYGDVPLISVATLQRLLSAVADSSVALLTVNLSHPQGYGRILRNSNGRVAGIVEEKDASEGERQIKEVNTGIMAVKGSLLHRWLPMLSNDNAQGEYYLTDIIGMAAGEGYDVKAIAPEHHREVEGINSRAQLASMERWHQHRLAEQLMSDGVTLMDPHRIDIRGSLSAGADSVLDVNLVIEGDVVLGREVRIGPNCVIANSTIGDGATIHANCVIEDAVVGDSAQVGPFARLRPGTVMEGGSKVGNFVETKSTTLGEGSKVNHLSYVGDSVVGRNVNIGAGTITCNYDGANKHKTYIEDGVFVGSNTSLVAPLRLGSGSTIGAGSTISGDVGEGQLAVARARQRLIDGWVRPSKKK